MAILRLHAYSSRMKRAMVESMAHALGDAKYRQVPWRRDSGEQALFMHDNSENGLLTEGG